MPSNKRLSAAASLETLLEEYASQRAKKASSITSSPPLKPVGSRQLGDAKRGERQTITQVVENDPHLREIIQRLLELKFLLPDCSSVSLPARFRPDRICLEEI